VAEELPESVLGDWYEGYDQKEWCDSKECWDLVHWARNESMHTHSNRYMSIELSGSIVKGRFVNCV